MWFSDIFQMMIMTIMTIMMMMSKTGQYCEITLPQYNGCSFCAIKSEEGNDAELQTALYRGVVGCETPQNMKSNIIKTGQTLLHCRIVDLLKIAFGLSLFHCIVADITSKDSTFPLVVAVFVTTLTTFEV